MYHSYSNQEFISHFYCNDISKIYELAEDEISMVQNYDVPFNLFDYNLPYRRKITSEQLMQLTSSQDQFNKLVGIVSEVNELLIIKTRKATPSNIINEYIDSFENSCLGLLRSAGINTVMMEVQNSATHSPL